MSSPCSLFGRRLLANSDLLLQTAMCRQPFSGQLLSPPIGQLQPRLQAPLELAELKSLTCIHADEPRDQPERPQMAGAASERRCAPCPSSSAQDVPICPPRCHPGTSSSPYPKECGVWSRTVSDRQSELRQAREDRMRAEGR